MNITFWAVAICVALHGIIAGISFDTALVKLPTRKRIGLVAYANFAKGNDLGNGLIVYPALGIAAVLLVFGTTLVAYFSHISASIMLPLLAACVGTIAHTLSTAKAAPIMLSLKHTLGDEKILTDKLNKFAFWNGYRAIFQFLTFVTLIWTLVKVS